MSKCPYKNFKNKIAEFIGALREPREEYGGLAACPFIGPEVDKDLLMIDLFDPSKTSFIEMVDKFTQSKYKSALFAQVTEQEISKEETRQYQNFLNKILKKEGHHDLKCICFNRDSTLHVDGFSIREQVPYFLINLANKEILAKTHNKLLKTKYFDKMNKEYLEYLHVKEEQLRRKK